MIKKTKNKVQFFIGKKKINLESPAFIIAEIGINHEGNFKFAKNLVDKATTEIESFIKKHDADTKVQ